MGGKGTRSGEGGSRYPLEDGEARRASDGNETGRTAASISDDATPDIVRRIRACARANVS